MEGIQSVTMEGIQTPAWDVIVQLRGSFGRAADGRMMFPSKEELQKAFDDFFARARLGSSVQVVFVLTEKNFVDLRDCKSPNHLLEVEEYFFSVSSADQAAFVLGIKDGIHIGISRDGRTVSTFVNFTSPPLDLQTRAVYRRIGQRVSALKQVDAQLRQLGAVPDMNGVPMLPDEFVQDEEFNSCISQLAGASVGELTKYLCTMVKVDRRGLMEKLQPLVARRLDLLIELCRINQTEFPFSFVRGFVGK
jgi:hypothetical protein